jgi:hypothetical protein
MFFETIKRKILVAPRNSIKLLIIFEAISNNDFLGFVDIYFTIG